MSGNIGEIEGHIADGEALMRRIGTASIAGWIFLVVGFVLFFCIASVRYLYRRAYSTCKFLAPVPSRKVQERN